MDGKRNPRRVDCHLHCAYSGHGEGSVAEIVAAASGRGFSTIALTEHLTMPDGWDPDNSYSLAAADSRAYHDDVLAARKAYPEMEIVYGAEADWVDDEDFLMTVCNGFDYLLGSVHFIDGWAFDDPARIAEWSARDVDAIWARYLEIWCTAAYSQVPFTCMSHPDLPKKFGIFPSYPLGGWHEQMAQSARESGRAVEVNTSGLRKTIGEAYPSLELLTAFRTHGVPCCIGSDAHRPQDVGAGIDEGLELMMRAGYREVYVPRAGGGLSPIPLEPLLKR